MACTASVQHVWSGHAVEYTPSSFVGLKRRRCAPCHQTELQTREYMCTSRERQVCLSLPRHLHKDAARSGENKPEGHIDHGAPHSTRNPLQRMFLHEEALLFCCFDTLWGELALQTCANFTREPSACIPKVIAPRSRSPPRRSMPRTPWRRSWHRSGHTAQS